MKKIFTLILVTLSSVSAYASPKALSVSPNGESVLACGVANPNFAAVVLRNDPEFNLENYIMFANWIENGSVGVFYGERTSHSLGVTGTRMSYEGTDSLPEYPYENWTVTAPQGTFYSARGNYIGFFMTNAEAPKGLLVSGNFEPVEMSCTNDLSQVTEWVKAVASFRPY